jgi:hypothetical protein
MASKIPVQSWHRLELKGSPVGVLMAFPVDGKLKRVYVRDHPRSALAATLSILIFHLFQDFLWHN